MNRLEELKADYGSWHSWISTYLEKAFSTDELQRNFSFVGIGAIAYNESRRDKIRELVKDLDHDVRFVERLLDRLALYDEPSRGLPAQQTDPARESHPPRSINITVSGPVAQLNSPT